MKLVIKKYDTNYDFCNCNCHRNFFLHLKAKKQHIHNTFQHFGKLSYFEL